ncbi:MAG: hypothetical protein PHH08_05165, partial [Candidatus ainarchaeum sp.]|nr:hypothetical protein [Candidatus ainarchaeum sp.]
SIMKGNSYLGGIDKFRDNCTRAQSGVKRIKFVVGLAELSSNPLSGAPGAAHFNPDGKPLQEIFFSPPEDLSGNGKFVCANTPDEIPDYYTVNIFPVALERNYLVDDSGGLFPVSDAARLKAAGTAFEERFFVKNMLLVVISWR